MPDPLDELELLRTATEQAKARARERNTMRATDEALEVQARYELLAIRHVGTLLERLRAAEAVCAIGGHRPHCRSCAKGSQMPCDCGYARALDAWRHVAHPEEHTDE